MASNKNTMQTPLVGSSIKAVLAERVYVNTALTAYTAPTAKLNGVDPSGSPAWTDLGVVEGSKATLAYNKEVKYVETGIEKVRRGAYLVGKTAQLTFTLGQYDSAVLAALTGLTAAVLGSPAIGKTLHMGQDDIVEKALLIIGTNKVDNKEHHIYCSKAALSFAIGEQDDARVLNVTADLYAFTPQGQTIDALFTLYIID